MNIEPRKNKNGEITSYRIVVYHNGKPYKKSLKRNKSLTDRQMEKEVQRVAYEFEGEVKHGRTLTKMPIFADYAKYVIELKERKGLSARTVDRYRELSERTDDAIGRLELSDISTKILNDFYASLSREGVRLEDDKAVAKPELKKEFDERNISRSEMHRRTGISTSTIGCALNGETILKKNADKIAKELGMPTEKLFTITKNTAPLAPKTIREYHVFISTVLTQAVKESIISVNPAGNADPPIVRSKDPTYYQQHEVDAILDALDKKPLKWRTLTYMLIDSGARRGEAAGAKWKYIDLEKGTWYIACALHYSKKRGIYESLPKNYKKRIVNLSPETIALLKLYKAEQEERRRIYGSKWVDTEYVFTQNNGEMMNPDSITQWLDKFSSENDLPHIHPHALRHTTASEMIAKGVDAVTAAAVLGHTPEVLLKIYSHVLDETRDKADEARFSVLRNRNRNENKNDPSDNVTPTSTTE